MEFISLNDLTRQLMLSEIELDISQDKLYLSTRLSENGRKEYANFLKEAANAFDTEWLTQQLQSNSRINPTEQRKKPKGGYTTVNVPATAAETLAEGEFNRFYMRALCRQVIENEAGQLTVYRAKAVASPRPESQAKIGTKVNAEALLLDLRKNIGIDTYLGLPSGPNSGLSVYIKN